MLSFTPQFKKQFQFYNTETAFSLRIHQVFLKNGNYFKNSRFNYYPFIMKSVIYKVYSILYENNLFSGWMFLGC